MKFEEKLKERKDWELWKEYCGFLDLTIDEFMAIQNRLMLEQIRKWRASGIGKTILKGRNPETIEEFRKMVPLTSYEDYADSLSLKDKSILPDDPVVWIQTTWEGGRHTIKLAPYTRSMLETYQNNMLGCLMLSTRAGGETSMSIRRIPFSTRLHHFPMRRESSLCFSTMRSASNFFHRSRKPRRCHSVNGIKRALKWA